MKLRYKIGGGLLALFAAAVEYSETGRARGKIIIDVE